MPSFKWFITFFLYDHTARKHNLKVDLKPSWIIFRLLKYSYHKQLPYLKKSSCFYLFESFAAYHKYWSPASILKLLSIFMYAVYWYLHTFYQGGLPEVEYSEPCLRSLCWNGHFHKKALGDNIGVQTELMPVRPLFNYCNYCFLLSMVPKETAGACTHSFLETTRRSSPGK